MTAIAPTRRARRRLDLTPARLPWLSLRLDLRSCLVAAALTAIGLVIAVATLSTVESGAHLELAAAGGEYARLWWARSQAAATVPAAAVE